MFPFSPKGAAGGLGKWTRPLFRAVVVAGMLHAAPVTEAQEIIQAQVLDLSVLDVQVIVIRARGDDQVQCLLRDAAGRVRVGGTQAVAAGTASGRTTVVAIPLPILDPQETEYAVTLVRGATVLDRTAWRPLFRRP